MDLPKGSTMTLQNNKLKVLNLIDLLIFWKNLPRFSAKSNEFQAYLATNSRHIRAQTS
jgi:hypothetical protein